MMPANPVRRVATLQTVVRLRRARDGQGRAVALAPLLLPDARVGRFSRRPVVAMTAAAGDFLRMGVLLLGSAAGFGIAAAGTALTGNGPVAAGTGGFALLCLLQALRNLGRWRVER